MPWEVACDRNWLSVEGSTLIAGEKSAEGIVVSSKARRRPERFPERGLKERRGRLLRKSGNASVGQLPLWDETDLGETIEDAPVGVHRLPRPNLPNRPGT